LDNTNILILRMIPMDTNAKNKSTKVIYPELSYILTGVCFSAHNELGRYAREKQYSNFIEKKLKESNVLFKRECSVGDSGNIIDFVVDDKIALELKAKRLLSKEDYFQTQRYLQESKLKLGLLVNFRPKYIKPERIVRIDTLRQSRYKN